MAVVLVTDDSVASVRLQSVFQEHRVPDKFVRKFNDWRNHPPTKFRVPVEDADDPRTEFGVSLTEFLETAHEMRVEHPENLRRALEAQGHIMMYGDHTNRFVKIVVA